MLIKVHYNMFSRFMVEFDINFMVEFDINFMVEFDIDQRWWAVGTVPVFGRRNLMLLRYIIGGQSITDSLITYWSLVSPNCILSYFGFSGELKVLSKYVPILMWNWNFKASTTWTVISKVDYIVTFLHKIILTAYVSVNK